MEGISPPGDGQMESLLWRRPVVVEAIRGKPWVRKYTAELREYTPATYEHSLRVTEIVTFLSESELLRLNPSDVHILARAGLLHDVGKLKIPNSILEKEGKLSDEERRLIEAHPETAFEELKEYDPDVAGVIRRHHRYQPKPYPDLTGEINNHLSELSEVLALADQTEALTAKRSYKQSLSLEETKSILEQRFDLRMVDLVLNVLVTVGQK